MSVSEKKPSEAQMWAMRLLDQKKRDFLNASAPYTHEVCKLEMAQPITIIIDQKTSHMESEINWNPSAKAYADSLNSIIEQLRQSVFEDRETKLALSMLKG